MQKEVKKSWALFIGIGVMMIAHGLQMQLMGIQMGQVYHIKNIE